MLKRRRTKPASAVMDQINVTPLLDLTFLLLIAFMITMPLMEYGTSINPPEMNGDDLPQDNFVSVTLTRNGTLMLGEETVTREELQAKLAEYSVKQPRPQVLVRGDGERKYHQIIDLLALVRRAGFHDAMLVTQAEADPK